MKGTCNIGTPHFEFGQFMEIMWDLSTSPKHLATIASLQHLFHQGHLHYYASHINQYSS